MVTFLKANYNLVQLKKIPYLDDRLSDICIGTSAAPTYLPPHKFNNEDKEGKGKEFNLVDGGMAANNPVYSSYNPQYLYISNEVKSLRTLN